MKTIPLKWFPLQRFFSLFIFCLVLSTSAFSQSKQIEFQAGFLGLKKYYSGFNSLTSYYSQYANLYNYYSGPNDKEYLYNGVDNYDAKITPLAFQLYYRQTIAKRWIFTTGLSYMQDGYGLKQVLRHNRNDTITTKDICLEDTYKHLNVPLQISYSFTDKKIRPYAGAGIYIGYLLSAKRTTTIKSSNGPYSEELDEMMPWGNIPMSDHEEKLSSGRIMLGLNAHIGLCFQLSKRVGITLPEIAVVYDLLRSATLYKEDAVGIPLGNWNKVEPLSRFTLSFGIRYSIN